MGSELSDWLRVPGTGKSQQTKKCQYHIIKTRGKCHENIL